MLTSTNVGSTDLRSRRSWLWNRRTNTNTFAAARRPQLSSLIMYMYMFHLESCAGSFVELGTETLRATMQSPLSPAFDGITLHSATDQDRSSDSCSEELLQHGWRTTLHDTTRRRRATVGWSAVPQCESAKKKTLDRIVDRRSPFKAQKSEQVPPPAPTRALVLWYYSRVASRPSTAVVLLLDVAAKRGHNGGRALGRY